MKNKLFKLIDKYPVQVVFILAAGLWLWLFRDFIAGRYQLINDAINYYEHFRFFFDNIIRGVYPLWDPSRDGGLPTEFFMRRMGEFNPIYWLVLIPYKMLGISYISSHLLFMVFYFLLGMTGFYLTAREIFNSQKIAVTALLLLLFSSMGTLIFCSFTILIFTPLIWFVFFVARFVRQQDRKSFLGATFALMILVQTYIPFYFFTILLVLFIFIGLFYFQECLRNFKSVFNFLMKDKLFALVCFALLGLALIPPIMFHKNVSGGDLVLMTRNYNSPESYFLGVPIQRGDFGGVIPNLILDELVLDIKQIKFSQIYIPCFAYTLIAFAFFVPINRRLIILFLSGFLIFALAIYDAPIYQFLYSHVFYFKYFRNYQFFFWIGVLPVFIFLCAEQMRLVLANMPSNKKENVLYFGKLVLIHLGVLWVLLMRVNVVWSSFVVLVLSFLFFIFLPQILKRGKPLFLLSLLIVVSVEPIEVFYYLSKNVTKGENRFRYHDGQDYLKLRLPEQVPVEYYKSFVLDQKHQRPLSHYRFYMITRWRLSFERLYDGQLSEIPHLGPIQLYDHIKWLDQEPIVNDPMGEVLLHNKNMAFVSLEDDKASLVALDNPLSLDHAEVIYEDSPNVIVKHFDVNEVTLKAKLDKPKFLVYFDHYYPGWKAFINGQEVKLWRANVAFKGVFVPAGESSIVFKFGTPWTYFLKSFLIGVFCLTFLWLVWLWRVISKYGK